MAIGRRTLIKGIFTGSAMLMGGMPVWATSQRLSDCGQTALSPTINLQTGTTMDEPFFRGVAAACSAARRDITNMRLTAVELANPHTLFRNFDSRKGYRLIGMMEDGPFLLFHEVARSLGKKFFYTGQHGWGGDSRYGSRHRILTVPQCRGIGQILAAGLVEDKQGYLISELALGSATPVKNPGLAIQTTKTDWAECLGEALTMVSLGRWTPVESGQFERAGSVTTHSVRENLTSFVITD